MSMHRRGFLRTLGAAGLGGLAFANVPASVARAETPPPVAGTASRFIAFVTPVGFVRDAWARSTGPRAVDFELLDTLRPLEPHRDALLLVKGLDMSVSYEGAAGGTGHPEGLGALLTGRELNPGSFGGRGVGWASGPSVDQLIAERLGADTRLRSLELGVGLGRRSTVFKRVSYLGSDRPLAAIDDPRVAFDRLFGYAIGDEAARARRRSEQRSVLDFLAAELDALRSRVGDASVSRVDNHLDALRDVEARIDRMAECTPPGVPAAFDPQDPERYAEIGRAQMDLLVAAMACNLTRVASLLWSGAASGQTFRFLADPIPEGHHALSHPGVNGIPVAEALAKQRRIYTFYARQFAYLLDRLAETPEPGGEGSLLDHTVLFWGTELAHAETHDRRAMRFVLAGGRQFFRTGRLVTVERSHNDLLVSLARSCGVDVRTFGAPSHCTGPLTELHR